MYTNFVFSRESNQYFGNLSPQGGNPHWNTFQLQGKYPWNGQIPRNYQPYWIPHPQGGDSPFNTIPQWNGKCLGNNQYFLGPPFEGENPPWNVNKSLGQWNYQVPPVYQTSMKTPIISPFLAINILPFLSQ